MVKTNKMVSDFVELDVLKYLVHNSKKMTCNLAAQKQFEKKWIALLENGEYPAALLCDMTTYFSATSKTI